jgi:hypothetical protein
MEERCAVCRCHGSAEEEALHFRAVEPLKAFALLSGLNPFGSAGDSEAVAEGENAPDQGFCRWLGGDVTNERTIDLESINRELP